MKLILASNSESRKDLLNKSNINFISYHHSSDEIIDHALYNYDLKAIVSEVCFQKIKSLNLNKIMEISGTGIVYILVADSLTKTPFGKILEKPKSLEEAKDWLMEKVNNKKEDLVGTAFHIKKYNFTTKEKIILSEHKEYVESKILVNFYNEKEINDYINFYNEKLLTLSGGFTITNFGSQYIKTINGSYTSALGLPLQEVKNALYKLGFFD